MSLNQAANTVNRKNLDLAGQTVLTRTKDLMISLESMIRKIDEDLKFRQDGPGWTSLLDSFSLIAGQVATLIKYLKDERTPELRFTSCYPTHLNPEPDEAVLRLTQGRVPCINHEIVDHFRTRPDPEVEKMIKGMRTEAEQTFNLNDAKTQADKLSQVCDNLLNRIEQHRDVHDGQLEKKMQMPQFFDKSDTEKLVATYTRGAGLTNLIQPPQRRPDQGPPMGQLGRGGGIAQVGPQGPQPGAPPPGHPGVGPAGPIGNVAQGRNIKLEQLNPYRK